MLTPRELAAGAHAAAIAQGRGRVLGAAMDLVTQERLVHLRTALRVIAAARGTERRFLREPDDANLDRMLGEVHRLEDALAAHPSSTTT